MRFLIAIGIVFFLGSFTIPNKNELIPQVSPELIPQISPEFIPLLAPPPERIPLIPIPVNGEIPTEKINTLPWYDLGSWSGGVGMQERRDGGNDYSVILKKHIDLPIQPRRRVRRRVQTRDDSFFGQLKALGGSLGF